MSTTTKLVSGKDLAIFIGSNMIGCATEVSLSLEVATDEVTCKASGGWTEVTPGTKSWSASASGVIKYYDTTDESTNEGVDDFMGYLIAGTKLTIKFSTQADGVSIVGDKYWSGEAYITSVEQTGGDGNATYSISFTGTGALAGTVAV